MKIKSDLLLTSLPEKLNHKYFICVLVKVIYPEAERTSVP